MTTLPPPPAEKPSGTAASFPPPTGAQILRGLRAPALGYAWLILGAIAATVLIVIAANVGSTGDDTGVESDDTNAIGVLLGMPVQIAGMALLGSLHFSSDGVAASVFLPPLLLTGLYLVGTARAARSNDVIPAAGTRAILAAVVGFVTAVVLTPFTWALAMREDGAALHAATVGMFFGVWALTGAASYLGTTSAAGTGRPAWIPSDYAAAIRLWFSSVGLWIAGSFVILTVVAAIKEDLWIAILSPIWGVTVSLYTYALGHIGALSFAGESIALGDFSAIWTIVMVVGALALALLTSLAWHLRRDVREASLAQPASWAVLPATYATGGLLVWLVPSVVFGGGFGAVGGSATLQPAFWLIFVLVVWGAVIEAASRFLAPSLVEALPPRLHSILRGKEPAAPAATTDSLAHIPEARPLTAEERARYRKLGIAAGVLAGLGVAAAIAVSVVNSQFFGPEDQIEAYLDAVVAGDLDEANDLAPPDDEADDALLTDEIYRASESRISEYEIGDVEKDGDTVTAEVALKGLGGEVEAELTLTKDGSTGVFFDRWRVADGGLAKAVSLSLPEGATDLTVNGVDGGSVDGDVWLLPGEYLIDPAAGNPWLETSGEPITVEADETYQYADVPAAVASEEFRNEVQRQIDVYLATCMEATKLDPENCPNSAFALGGDVRKVKWELVQAPTPDFDSFDGTFPADLSYGESGSATVTFESDQSYGFGPRDWQAESDESELYLSSVVVTEEGDGLKVTISDD